MPDPVTVWWIDLRTEVDPGPLDPKECERAADFRDPVQRRRFVTAHVAVREILGMTTGRAPERIAMTRGRYGKPRLIQAGPPFSLSHSGDVALLAVGADREVGIDVEQVRPQFPARTFARRYFPPPEADFVGSSTARYATLWTRKEACVKVAGERLVRGLGLPVGDLREPIVGTGPRSAPGPFRCADLSAPEGFAAAVALAGTTEFAVRKQTWSARSRSHG